MKVHSNYQNRPQKASASFTVCTCNLTRTITPITSSLSRTITHITSLRGGMGITIRIFPSARHSPTPITYGASLFPGTMTSRTTHCPTSYNSNTSDMVYQNNRNRCIEQRYSEEEFLSPSQQIDLEQKQDIPKDKRMMHQTFDTTIQNAMERITS